MAASCSRVSITMARTPIGSRSSLTLPTPHAKLNIAKAAQIDSALLEKAQAWCVENQMHSDYEIRAQLKKWVPEYLPEKGGGNAIQAVQPTM